MCNSPMEKSFCVSLLFCLNLRCIHPNICNYDRLHEMLFQGLFGDGIVALEMGPSYSTEGDVPVPDSWHLYNHLIIHISHK